MEMYPPRRVFWYDRDMKQDAVAVFGGGCFWCTEAVFRMLRGVTSVRPGYAGGTTKDPTYEEVSGGQTGHVEVVEIRYDPEVVKYRDLLAVFFGSHDPTTLNRQGSDVGTQYRSVVFYTTPEQRDEALDVIKEINSSNPEGAPVVTTVEPLAAFYDAEDYYRNYFKNHPENPYCELVINPKLEKVQQHFAHLLEKA